MLHVAVAAIKDDVVAGILALLAANLREEVREAVVVVHRPAIKGMVVTLRALDAHAHEDLRGVLRDLQRVGRDLVIVGRRLRQGAAAGRKKPPDDLIDGDVGQHLVAEPVVVGQRGLRAELVLTRANLQQLRKLHHPKIRELRPVEQRLHQMLALGGAGVGDKLLQILRRRQRAGDVERGATDERGVIAQLARADAELLQLRVDQFVDVVVARKVLGKFKRLILRHHDDLRADGERVEAGHDERLAALSSRDDSALGDLRARLVVADEHRERGHVAVAAVGILRANDETLEGIGTFEDRLLRRDFQADDAGDIRGVLQRALLNPLQRGAVEFAILLESLAARVRDRAKALFEQQAFLGQGEVDAPTDLFPRQPVVIAVRVVAKK